MEIAEYLSDPVLKERKSAAGRLKSLLEDHHTGGIYESYGRGWIIQPKPEDEKWLKGTGLEHNENKNDRR